VVRRVSWDGPGPVASGVGMPGVECTLWGCVSWGYPGPVTPIKVMGPSQNGGNCSDSFVPDIAVEIVAVVILTWFGWRHTSLDGGNSYADPITITRDLAPPLSHVGTLRPLGERARSCAESCQRRVGSRGMAGACSVEV
jgi:hypothetical protein